MRIQYYFDEHPPPHFHAVFAEFVVQIQIDPLKLLRGNLPLAKLASVLAWVAENNDALKDAWETIASPPKAKEAAMSEIIPMKSVEPVLYGVVKIVWRDGFEAIVDLRPVLSDGQAFAFLHRAPERFNTVKLSDFGHSIYWLDDQRDEIDFGSDSLRQRAERQADLIRHAS